MYCIYAPAHELHDPPHEFYDGALIPVFETPERAAIILRALNTSGLGPVLPPRSFGLEPLRAVHSDDYLDYLAHAYDRWVKAGGNPAAVLPGTLAVRWMHRHCTHPLAAPGYYAFDMSAPIVAGTYQAARESADVALTGAALLLEGQPAAYALCRPPGHHAGRSMCGGYCFLNNAAIAAAYLLAHGGHARVAILDIDIHHGNGTQEIFYERGDVLVVSLHGDPAWFYPYFLGYADERGAGAGLGANLNIPLPNGTDDATYMAALDTALDAVHSFAPGFLVVSTGLDTFGEDPVDAAIGFLLTHAAYPEIGRRIAALALPTLFVQEGGYAVAELGQNLVAVLHGFEG